MYRHIVITILAASTVLPLTNGADYYGKYIGAVSRLNHGVSGEVYAVDARTLHIRDFTYDGEGPAAYFYVGNTKAPGSGGYRVRDEDGSSGVLKRYNKKHITLTLPEGKTLNNIKWFSVWCDEFAVNFGDIRIPRGLDYPKPQKIGPLSGVHGVSSESIVVVDAQTLLVPSFSYDGEAPDAKFWVGQGPKPSPQGIRVPDENGKQNPLRRYDRKTIVLTLPGELTIFDIGHFGVWCEAFTVDFGHVLVPPSLNVPPSLKMLGVSPQSKLNCEVMDKDVSLEVRWAVAGDSIVIQLVSKLEEGEYMSFGVSGDDERSLMIGGDVVVAWVDKNTLNGYAEDYYLDDKSQCAGTSGSCPDYRLQSNTNSVRLLNAALVNGYSIVTYQRPLLAHDNLDRTIRVNGSQPIIWAIGPINSKNEVSYHSITSKGDVFLDFGRPPKWNCPIPETDKSSVTLHPGRNPPTTEQPTTTLAYVEETKTPPPPAPVARRDDAWEIPPIQCNEPEDGVFYAQMGPTGGKRGYSAITGHVGWGISYYMNGLLIPEINVVRGHTYTFVVEGGRNPEVPAQYHPFYITDDPVGGFHHKTAEEKRKTRIFAGVEYNKKGELVPTGVGRLCNWTPDPEENPADEFSSFGAYQRTLTLICDQGEPGIITWTPDRDTPDTVYYQCFVHRYLGWKINVLDDCDLGELPAASEQESTRLEPRPEDLDELISRPSIRVTTRVKPDFPLSQTIVGKNKYSNKDAFPYKIVRYEGNNASDNHHVIPVTEDIDEEPIEGTVNNETTTRPLQEATPTNSTMVETAAAALPLVQRPFNNMNPPRNGGFRRPARPHRPYHHHHHQQSRPHIIVMGTKQQHPPQIFINQRPPSMQPAAPSSNRPVIVKKPLMRLPQRPQNTVSRHPPPSFVIPNRMAGKPQYVHKFKKPLPHNVPMEMMEKNRNKLHPSQMIGQTSEEISPGVPPAVNTGFNPGSLVIEGGFRPILQNRTATAQDRISDYIEEEEDNVEGVINMAEESAPSSERQTEMFEPVFVPSPMDSHKQAKKPTAVVHGKKRRVVLRRPVYKKKQEALRFDETPMAAEKRETFSAPPFGGREQIVLSYDGKEVAGVLLPPGTESSRTGGSALLTQSPQFGPFKGEVPPPITGGVLHGDIPQLRMAAKSRPITAALLDAHRVDEVAQPSEEKQLIAEPLQDDGPEQSQPNPDGRDERRKRSTDHEPGHHDHNNHSDHDHDHSDHDHDHSDHDNNSTSTDSSAVALLPISTIGLLLSLHLLHMILK